MSKVVNLETELFIELCQSKKEITKDLQDSFLKFLEAEIQVHKNVSEPVEENE